MNKTQLKIPKLSLVLLVGVTNAGKSTFAKKHFLPTEIISLNDCKGIVSDDANNEAATKDALDVLHYIVEKRLKRGKLIVVDAKNLRQSTRQTLFRLAKKYYFLTVAIVFNMPEELLKEREQERTDRKSNLKALRKEINVFEKAVKIVEQEKITKKFYLTPENVEKVSFVRYSLRCNKQHEKGSFDIIGDIHGCFIELRELLEKLGYQITDVPLAENYGYAVTHSEGRRAFFVGDFVDRGPNSPRVLRLVMSMVKTGIALAVPGNHDAKLYRNLRGKKTNLRHGLEETLQQLSREPAEFINDLKNFIRGLAEHNVVDDGKLVVAHAGIREDMHGRSGGKVKSFCLYGDTTGEKDEFGLPVRLNWGADYRGKAIVVYGHTPVLEAEWQNNTIDIDTGCVFGGKLTALRYPEKELVSVKAKRQYAVPTKPLDYDAKKKM